MSAINAQSLINEEPDYLAGALLNSFSRHLGTRASWSFLKTLLWSTVTFGIGPLLVWPRGLRGLIATERSQFLHLAEWMRLRSGAPDTSQLVAAAERVKINPILSYGPVWIASAVVIAFGIIFSQVGFSVRDLIASTYHFGRGWPRIGPIAANELFTIWSTGLLTAYTLHWFQLLAHASKVRNAVRAFNELAIPQGLPPVREPRGVGLRPIWLAAALVMMSANAMWAIPMMLAGGMQRRYAAVTGPALRGAVADRLRDMLMVRRPMMRVPSPIAVQRRCPNEQCRAEMPRIANFCPTCGKHVGPEIDELA